MRLRKILLCLAAGFALVFATQSARLSAQIYYQCPGGYYYDPTTDVCPYRIFTVRLPTYYHSPALVSFMAAIGAVAADIRMAEAGSPTAGVIPAGAVTPVAAAMAVKWGIVATSGGTGGRRSGRGEYKPPHRTEKGIAPH